ncbi:MAG TPA: hypothetical protein VL098_15035 [Flavipsychrobacter sp.]|nr:hypothetical protein [Flavipsychrobacter sp.]
MSRRPIHSFFLTAIVVFFIALTSCSSTKNLKEGQYLLRKNTIQLKTNKGVTRRGELKENLESLVVQKTNTRTLLGLVPLKLWLYNLRYEKYQKDTTNFQIKSRTVEAPVVFDSLLMERTVMNFKSYLFNSGYFYPVIKDTFIFRKKKAYVTYKVETGINYLINDVFLDVDDSVVKETLLRSMNESLLKKGREFSMSLVDDERSRMTNLLKDAGYFRFTQENIINVRIDTFDKRLLRDDYNPFETIINTLALQNQKQRNPTLDVTVFVRKVSDSNSYKKFYLNRVNIYPDFISRDDIRDSSMFEKRYKDARFRYHDYYIREKVLYNNIFFEKGNMSRQSDYDNTINRLNDLGVFNSVRIFQSIDTTQLHTDSGFINSTVLLSPSNKYDFSTNFEISNGTTYTAGSAIAFTFRDKNFLKGANLLSVSLRGGLETNYDQFYDGNFLKKFRLFTRSAGVNASLNLPKFLAPFNGLFKDKNVPRTIFSAGTNILERVSFFTATNTTAAFTYNWRETATRTWEFSPVFISNFQLPVVTDSFKKRLDSVEFLRKLYTPTFIEGENFNFVFSNQLVKKGRSYTYAKLGVEEAGLLMSAIDKIAHPNVNYAQYVKFDFDVRRYINRLKSQVATRIYGGIGIPYGRSAALPYVKQYFSGGPYSIRGWRIRTLGPGTFYDPGVDNKEARDTLFIDRTGDIKLEGNAEYRFDIVQLFYGVVKMKGALFVDGGNIWYAKANSDFPGGEFRLNRFYRDLAVSTGAGLRFDLAGFFIFRLDAAFPLKKPYGSNSGWVTDQIDILNGYWRRDNVVLNIGIGYPF